MAEKCQNECELRREEFRNPFTLVALPGCFSSYRKIILTLNEEILWNEEKGFSQYNIAIRKEFAIQSWQ